MQMSRAKRFSIAIQRYHFPDRRNPDFSRQFAANQANAQMQKYVDSNLIFFSINCILTRLGRGLEAAGYWQNVYHQICNKHKFNIITIPMYSVRSTFKKLVL